VFGGEKGAGKDEDYRGWSKNNAGKRLAIQKKRRGFWGKDGDAGITIKTGKRRRP